MNPRLKMNILMIIVLSFSLIIFGCIGSAQGKNNNLKNTGLQIYSMSTGLGAVSEDNTDHQRLTYVINLTNENDTEADIQWIEPILSKNIIDKVITEELRVNVENSISVKGSLKIEGIIILDTQGLSKEEIISLDPFITGIKIGGEKVIIIKT